jgi:hypothetical protein
LVAGILLLSAMLILYKFQYYKICAWLVALTILLLSGLNGIYTAGTFDMFMAPYFFFGTERVNSENIKVVDYEDGNYLFSNGEKARADGNSKLEVLTKITFVIAAGIPLLLGLYIAIRITDKYLPKLNAELSAFMPAKKR